MINASAIDGVTRFPPNAVALRIAIALAVVMLVGFDRESASKDVGIRTFGLTALLRAVSVLISPMYGLAAMAGASTTSVVLLVTLAMFVRNIAILALFAPKALFMPLDRFSRWPASRCCWELAKRTGAGMETASVFANCEESCYTEFCFSGFGLSERQRQHEFGNPGRIAASGISGQVAPALRPPPQSRSSTPKLSRTWRERLR